MSYIWSIFRIFSRSLFRMEELFDFSTGVNDQIREEFFISEQKCQSFACKYYNNIDPMLPLSFLLLTGGGIMEAVQIDTYTSISRLLKTFSMIQINSVNLISFNSIRNALSNWCFRFLIDVETKPIYFIGAAPLSSTISPSHNVTYIPLAHEYVKLVKKNTFQALCSLALIFVADCLT